MSSRFLSHFQTFYVGFPCRGCLLKPIPFGATFIQEKHGKKKKQKAATTTTKTKKPAYEIEIPARGYGGDTQ